MMFDKYTAVIHSKLFRKVTTIKSLYNLSLVDWLSYFMEILQVQLENIGGQSYKMSVLVNKY
jgi:hypothetical protein